MCGSRSNASMACPINDWLALDEVVKKQKFQSWMIAAAKIDCRYQSSVFRVGGWCLRELSVLWVISVPKSGSVIKIRRCSREPLCTYDGSENCRPIDVIRICLIRWYSKVHMYSNNYLSSLSMIGNMWRSDQLGDLIPTGTHTAFALFYTWWNPRSDSCFVACQ